MNAPPTDFARALAAPPRADDPLAEEWAAVHEAAAAVAALAGLAEQPPGPQVRAFPARIAAAGGWRLELARNGVADLMAMMRPGIEALLTVSARGQDPQPAAIALWREFEHARAALVALVPTPG